MVFFLWLTLDLCELISCFTQMCWLLFSGHCYFNLNLVDGWRQYISVRALYRDNTTLVHQPRGGARRGGYLGVLFRKTLQLVSRVTANTRASETLSVAQCPHRLHKACGRTDHKARVFGSFLDGVSIVLRFAVVHLTESRVRWLQHAGNMADVTGASHER